MRCPQKQRFSCDSVRASHWSFTKNSQQQKCGHNITFQCWMKSNREIAWDGENERLRELNKRWRWIFRCCYCKVAFAMCTSFIYRIVAVAVAAAAAEASSLLGWLVSCDRINRFCKRSFSTAIIRISLTSNGWSICATRIPFEHSISMHNNRVMDQPNI